MGGRGWVGEVASVEVASVVNPDSARFTLSMSHSGFA